MSAKTVCVQYFAMLREKRGLSQENVQTTAVTALDLYKELSRKYSFIWDPQKLRVAVNQEYREWGYLLNDNDQVIFIPPVAGG